jgi:hypothetical protein
MVVEILENQDGTFAMLKAGKLLHASIPDRWLETELAKYGFCGEEYRDIRRQLDSSGNAQFTVYIRY